MVAMVNGALVSDAVIVVTVTFHEGLELIDRYGAERGLELINAEPAGRQCEKRFQAAPDVSVDWTVSPDGIINLHATYGGLQPHGDDHTPPDPFHELSALCE
jgi:hypothetical protein